MIKISINAEIGRYWGIRETDIAEQLKAVTDGEEIEILINSPGGEVYEGIAIFNLIREYAKNHNVIVRINGLAASMASYIAIAARTVNPESKIIVSENSIFLIHNPWNYISGDYRQMAKAADYLERLAAMSGSTYAYVSGKTEKETRALMDEETYFIGEEIISAGFANEFEIINKEETASPETDRNSLLINAKLRIEKTVEKMRENKNAEADLERAAALITKPLFRAPAPGKNNGLGNNTPGNSAEGVGLLSPTNLVTEKPGEEPAGTEGGKMTKEELKAKYPELYALIFAEGKQAGTDEERERVSAHLKLGEDSGNMKIAAQFIREGETVMKDKVQAEYLSARMNKQSLDGRNQDNPPPVNGASGSGQADDAAIEAAWANGLSGKDLQGEK